MQIGIIDYGAGNPVSVMHMLGRVGVASFISTDPKALERACKLILPGIGAFDAAMQQLERSGIAEMLQHKVIHQHAPFLGICLGMQLITSSSEEGALPGLGWIEARTVRLRTGDITMKVPHVGWNRISVAKESMLLQNIGGELKFYFSHAYHTICGVQEDVLATTEYGAPFVSAFARGNIAGVQFHPEKSGKYGARLLKNFADYF